MNDEIITGLDIGAHSIHIAVGKPMPIEDGEREQIHIIGAIEVPAEGINRGTITNMDEAVSSVSRALDLAERITGVPVSSAWVAIAGPNIHSQDSRGVVGVSRGDGEIKDEDVERVIEAAKTVATPSNYEILHVIPRAFTVDGQRGVKDPIGMSGVRLEVDATIVQALGSQMNNLTKCVYRTGLDIDDLVYAPLATSESVITPRQKELGVAVVNIGASTTSIILFEEGDMVFTSVLPIGSGHITNDIAIGLRTSIEIAEHVKLKAGSADSSEIQKKDEIDLADFGAPESEFVSRKYIAQIIEARVEEIMAKIDDEFKKAQRSGMLPAGVVFTGAGSKLAGIVDVAKKELRLPASIGTPIGVTTVIDQANDPAFSTAIGLVLWGQKIHGTQPARFMDVFSKIKSIDAARDSLKKWFKSMLP
ncbi:MAG: hypothetical protein ACD_76C00125G0003 [uncultured bacterium]|nr:MAG: hypothetical protein ACD_76C00125G0003 [uncultured bacterium]HBD05492.1 cell division protein FtsA [Candidatus Uhrbacteria bacterium]